MTTKVPERCSVSKKGGERRFAPPPHWIGDQVVALPEYRAWAELVAVPAKYVFKLPQGMSPQDAVAIIMNYIVAYILLFGLGGLSNGKSVLVHSAGGGVGQAVAQLAKTLPDVTIFGVCSKSKHEALKASNSPIDHPLERSNDYVAEIRKVLGGKSIRRLMYQQGGTDFVKSVVDKIFALYKEGKIKPVVDSTWALEDVHDEPKPKPATPAKGKSKEDKKKQPSEEKKDREEKKAENGKEEEKKEEKKDEPLTNGESAGKSEKKILIKFFKKDALLPREREREREK
ncbi:hypothetical protein FQA39_LY07881 [Lamprigera yunnana]|nr:hypothetical protein FQA39_LY07881 [Lamprigera yunnana]